MSDQWIRASEISEYVYCHRSWWYRRVMGRESVNVVALSRGTTYHHDHGTEVGRSLIVRRLAYLLLALAAAVILFSMLGVW